MSNTTIPLKCKEVTITKFASEQTNRHRKSITKVLTFNISASDKIQVINNYRSIHQRLMDVLYIEEVVQALLNKIIPRLFHQD